MKIQLILYLVICLAIGIKAQKCSCSNSCEKRFIECAQKADGVCDCWGIYIQCLNIQCQNESGVCYNKTDISDKCDQSCQDYKCWFPTDKCVKCFVNWTFCFASQCDCLQSLIMCYKSVSSLCWRYNTIDVIKTCLDYDCNCMC